MTQSSLSKAPTGTIILQIPDQLPETVVEHFKKRPTQAFPVTGGVFQSTRQGERIKLYPTGAPHPVAVYTKTGIRRVAM